VHFIVHLLRMKKGTKNTQGARKRVQERGIPKQIVGGHLPQLTDQLHTSITLRFVSTANFAGVTIITWYNLLDSWFFAGTAALAYQLFDFVRLREVRVMAVGSTGATAVPNVTVGVEISGLSNGMVGSGVQVTDTALGVNSMAQVRARPGKSLAGAWQIAQQLTAFTVRASDGAGTAISGAICEVDLDFKNSADVAPANTQNAVAGLVPGNLYYGALDGKRLATTEWRSVFQLRA